MSFLESVKDHFYAWLIWHRVVALYPGFHNRRQRKEWFRSCTGYYRPLRFYRCEVKEVSA